MEFGMFHQFPVVPGGSEHDAFESAFEQVDAAERYGLDAMWLAELHVDPARSVLAAPMTIASAIAARTDRIKIGIAVQVLPLCHPLPGKADLRRRPQRLAANLRSLWHPLCGEQRPLCRDVARHRAGVVATGNGHDVSGVRASGNSGGTISAREGATE